MILLGLVLSKSGFLKVGEVPPRGSLAVKGPLGSREVKAHTRYSRVDDIRKKKLYLTHFNGSFESLTYIMKKFKEIKGTII